MPKFTNNWFDVTAKEVWRHLLSELGPRTYLEVGSWEGASACFFMEMCPGGEVHCVDNWKGSEEHVGLDMQEIYERCLENLDEMGEKTGSNVRVHDKDSEFALAQLLMEGHSNFFEFIYIDGAHDAPSVLKDACAAWPLLKQNGALVFDDYLWGGGQGVLTRPKVAIDAFCNVFAEKGMVVFSGAQVVVRKVSK